MLSHNSSFRAVEPPVKSEKKSDQNRDANAGLSDDSSKKANESKDENTAEARREQVRLEEEAEQIKQLAARDREVRAHEMAHMAVGGQYAGSASYQYERGPDGINYAVGGEVPISTGKENTPEATISKAQIIRRAALAPAEPSPQDRRVAAQATTLEVNARKEIVAEQRKQAEEAKSEKDAVEANASGKAAEKDPVGDSVGNVEPAGKSAQTSPANQYNVNTISSLPSPFPGSTEGRLLQSISNSAVNSHSPGSILQQIA